MTDHLTPKKTLSAEAPTAAASYPIPPSRQTRKAVTTWQDEVALKQLRSLSHERGESQQALLAEALDLLFAQQRKRGGVRRTQINFRCSPEFLDLVKGLQQHLGGDASTADVLEEAANLLADAKGYRRGANRKRPSRTADGRSGRPDWRTGLFTIRAHPALRDACMAAAKSRDMCLAEWIEIHLLSALEAEGHDILFMSTAEDTE